MLAEETPEAPNRDHLRVAIPPRAPVWRDRLFIALAYSIGWGALVVNRGLYWDDWVIVGLSPADISRGSAEIGQPLAGYFFTALYSLPQPGLIGHILVFGAYLGSALTLHAILRRMPDLSRMDALVAALTFALLPVNYARIALVDLMYAFSLLAFLAATWLLIRFVEHGGLARRVGALLLFLLSFYTASLLVFYVVPVAIAAVLLRRSRTGSTVTLALRHADFLALPVAFWLLKIALSTPSGIYEGYNGLSIRGFLQVPRAMLSVPNLVLVEPLSRAVVVAGLVGLIAGLGVAFWLVRRGREVEEGHFVSTPLVALVGVAMVALGVFAYLAVGLVPSVWNWTSRHQLLVPVGAGLLAAALARGVRGFGSAGRAGGLVAVGLLLGISAIADARTMMAYQVDWFKQQALIEAVRAMPELQMARRIRVVDSATAFNAMRRFYRFYELNALFMEATGNTRRLVAIDGREPTGDVELFISHPAYHMGEYTPSPVDLELSIDPGQTPHSLDVLRLVVLEAVGSPSFEPEVSQLIKVRASPVSAIP